MARLLVSLPSISKTSALPSSAHPALEERIKALARSSQVLIATAPSGFQAGGVDFRAGEYRFSRPNLVVLRAALPGGRYVSMFLTIGIVNPAGDFEAKPITNCCGEKCFLPQV